MAIEVSCPECFYPYRVKSEHAGRTIRCKECGTAITVPARSEGVMPPPRRQSSGPSAAQSKRKTGAKKRKRSAGSVPVIDAVGWPAAVGAGMLVISGLSYVTVPGLLVVAVLPFALTGIALTLWGALKCLAAAFTEDVVCGVMWLVVPFYSLYYTITRWNHLGRYFVTFAVGLCLTWTPAYLLKLTAEQRQLAADKELGILTGDPGFAADYEPPAEIADPPEESPAVAGTARPASSEPSGTDASDALTTAPRSSESQRSGRPDLPARASSGPDEAILMGRTDARKAVPPNAEFIRERESGQPGDPVWILDAGWWFPGEIVEAVSPVQFVVRFDGWDESRDRPVPRAALRTRHPDAKIPDSVSIKLKLIDFPGPDETLPQRIEEALSSYHGFVAGSTDVNLRDRVITYTVAGDSRLIEPLTATAALIGRAKINSIGIGRVRERIPNEPRMLVEMAVHRYTGSVPMKEAAHHALSGFDQYVPRSVVADEERSMLRFLIIDGVRSGERERPPLTELRLALSHFGFNSGNAKSRPFRPASRR